MKSATYRTPARLQPKTPMQRQLSDGATDPVQVYCRIRPLSSNATDSCVEVLSSKTIALRPVDNTTNYKLSAHREMQYTFKHVFDQNSSQQEVYATVAQPLVEGLIKGKNGLLFTYGVTSSGKTYTMAGNVENRGVMPRCLEVLFRTISDYQTKKFVFKPDKMNGFEILSDADAAYERQHEIHAKFGKLGPRKDSDPEIASRASTDVSGLEGIVEDNMYAVFVTYVEVYNNSVYDLLEDGPIGKTLQTKIIRGDEKQNMYVHGVTEIEVKCVSDAIEAYRTGQKRKRTGHTILNSESSRSHSVFTIRLVQAPTDSRGEQLVQDRRQITVSQLSLVDLAGSERTSRTNNTGQRLREAGNINNSLMTLRQCLETLRRNQMTSGPPTKVPYRDAKITHLFKNYFDGEGQVRMIVCINPRSEDYDETTQVMKFAEMTQEVQVARPTPMKLDYGMTPGRRRNNQLFRMVVNNLGENGVIETKNLDVDLGLVYSLGPKFPDFNIDPEKAGELIAQLLHLLDQRIAKRAILVDDYGTRREKFRLQLAELEAENSNFKHKYDSEHQRVLIKDKKIESLEEKIISQEGKIDEISRQLRDYQNQVKLQQDEIVQLKYDLDRNRLIQQKQKIKYSSQMAQTEELREQLANELRANQTKDDKYREDSKILKALTEIINKKEGFENVGCRNRNNVTGYMPNVPTTPAKSVRSAIMTFTPKTMRNPPPANNRYRRRSKSADRVLEHRPEKIVPVNTILQPLYTAKRKSITKLTDSKALKDGKTTQYVLIDQGADTDGDLETRLYTGDVIPSSGGGAQVIFNDMEILKQKSPVVSPSRKRPSDTDIVALSPGDEELTARCSIGIQGKKSKY